LKAKQLAVLLIGVGGYVVIQSRLKNNSGSLMSSEPNTVTSSENENGIFDSIINFDIGEAVESVKNVFIPRAVRNNNPLNIRISSSAWQGKINPSTDMEFEQFSNVQYGFRAAAKTIKTYNSKYGLNTLRGIISRWAPSNENNTNSYMAFVSKQLGISPDLIIDVTNREMLAQLVYAMSIMEAGRGWFSLDEARQGVALV
jgi:hypothetical protein